MIVTLKAPLAKAPDGFDGVTVEDDGKRLVYTYDARGESKMPALLRELEYTDLETKQSSLEEIFVSLVHS
jgi:ABC-2 type transport system ATP-binding protein